ncbi:MAG TPA: NAD(P)/FAD-dependent oxidoreductase [Myxococcota bacterium]|nr:NAD(P)/FAD-dependent oxidoreductase [Myxococcota bacterium]
MTPKGDVAVIGAGVVGLATAAALARDGHEVVVLERHGAIARETTSRNSGVIHAGLYYPPGSAKAELCRRGRELLYERCAAHRIPHRRIGKLVVATRDGEVETLERLRRTGSENGAPGLELIGGAAVARLEPQVRAEAALCSPATGIVDPEALALDFAAEAEACGAELAFEAELVGIDPSGSGFALAARRRGGALDTIACAGVVNAAGLGAPRVASLAGLDLAARGERLHPCKGDYFAVAPGAPIRLSRLVYPVPGEAGLGIHATLDLAGRLRLGPDAEYVDEERYDVDPGKAPRFADSARRWLPTLEARWLAPDSAGIRPKLAGPGEGFRDFVIREESAAGRPGFVNLVGIESPGLTAAPAIGERVAALLRGI